MAPEIVLNNKEFNNSIDIWSVGIIIYELIAGRYLFDIYKDNLQNGNNFKNYNLNQKSKITTDYSYTDSADSYEKSYKIEYLSLLYNYKFILGDNTLLYGNDLDIFYSNNLKDILRKILRRRYSIYKKEISTYLIY